MTKNKVPVRCWTTVRVRPGDEDRVLLKVAGLVLPMLPHQARQLADDLHDAADQLDERR